MTDDADTWRQVDAALAAGNKLLAIKVYRSFRDVGLREAKTAVEHRMRELQFGGGGAASPATPPPQKKPEPPPEDEPLTFGNDDPFAVGP